MRAHFPAKFQMAVLQEGGGGGIFTTQIAKEEVQGITGVVREVETLYSEPATA